MKNFIVALLILPLFAVSQECTIKKEVDPYTKEVKFSTGLIPFNQGIDRFLLSIDANKSEIDFFFTLNASRDGKCFDAASTATIIFDGNKLKTNFKNTGYMNCEGMFHFTFRNTATTPSALQKFATQKIASITLTGNNKTITVLNINDIQKQLLMAMATCIIKEARGLLK
ncbi:MAG: hypothetical protein ABR502_03975 [Chitinophagaceae bacterium]